MAESSTIKFIYSLITRGGGGGGGSFNNNGGTAHTESIYSIYTMAYTIYCTHTSASSPPPPGYSERRREERREW